MTRQRQEHQLFTKTLSLPSWFFTCVVFTLVLLPLSPINAWTSKTNVPATRQRATANTPNTKSYSSKTTRLYSTTSSGGKDSALTTTRVPLTRIFNGEREYLFTTKRNVRNFEWTISEIEDLFESILTLSQTDETDELELNAITILPSTMPPDYLRRIGRASQIYDVHDGQQRLVTLCLLLAALRDNLLVWDAQPPPPPPAGETVTNSNNNHMSSVSSSTYEDDAREVWNAIFPVKSRLEHVNRIQLRDKHGKWLSRIISKRDRTGKVLKKFSFPKSRDRKNPEHLSTSERLIIEGYEYCYSRIQELGPTTALEVLWENFMSRVYLLVCIPANTRIARNIVMGLGKGKNMEPVDEFKGMVCFNSIPDEIKQDLVLEDWNKLCEQVGRGVVEKACLYNAKIYLQKPLKRNGEVDMMEVFLKKYLEDHNHNHINGDTVKDGRDVFDDLIVPVAKTLQNIQDLDGAGTMTMAMIMDSSRGGNSSHHWPSIKFLWSVCTTVTTAKELEVVVLYLVMKWQACRDSRQKIAIQTQLRKLERIALWMMLAQPKPSPAKRFQRCLDIVEYCNGDTLLEESSSPLELSTDEQENVLRVLDEFEFASSSTRANMAKILLDRLNESILISSNQGRVTPIMATTLQLEHVLPQKHMSAWKHWDATDANDWMHRLGNLALLNQKVNVSISNGPFPLKQGHLGDSPYPLTREIAKYDEWNVASVQRQHDRILQLAASTWQLKPASNDKTATAKPATAESGNNKRIPVVSVATTGARAKGSTTRRRRK